MKNVTSNMKSMFKRINWGELGILYALLILWVILIIANEKFRSFGLFNSIFREASFSGICGIGMTYCIASKHFDQSIASMMAFVSCCLTLMLGSFTQTMGAFGIVVSIVLAILLATLCGFFNGLLVAKLRIPAFIATLGTLYAFRALAFIVSKGDPITLMVTMDKGLADSFCFLGYGDFLGIPVPFWIMVVCAIIGTIMLRKTKLCRDVLAIGNSVKASYISGINVDKTKILIFILVGLFTGIGTVLNTAYLGSSNPGMKTGFEFIVISTVVLGGTALAGGKGSIFTTIIAAIFIATVTTGMDAFGIDSFAQRVVQGAILLFAFSINTIRIIMENYNVRKKAAAQSVAASS